MKSAISHLVFYCSLCLILLACNPRPDRPEVVGEIKQMSKLATLEAVLSKIVIGNKKARILGIIPLKDAAFLAYSEASVKVGIDLDKITHDDIVIEDNSISLRLPPIELLNFSYPAEKFDPDPYYSEDNSRWNDFTFEELDQLFQESQAVIMKSIPYMGITRSAEKRTRQLMTALLKRLGFEEIYIEFNPTSLSS